MSPSDFSIPNLKKGNCIQLQHLQWWPEQTKDFSLLFSPVKLWTTCLSVFLSLTVKSKESQVYGKFHFLTVLCAATLVNCSWLLPQTEGWKPAPLAKSHAGCSRQQHIGVSGRIWWCLCWRRDCKRKLHCTQHVQFQWSCRAACRNYWADLQREHKLGTLILWYCPIPNLQYWYYYWYYWYLLITISNDINQYRYTRW